MLRVAIVGCGKIADEHASQIRRIRDCRLVGVCDNEPLMARQLQERFAIERSFTQLSDLLSDTRPDVVHITTPPASHFEIASACLESGCHVYVEKPFTVCEAEAQRLVSLATERRLKVTVGHDFQFSHVTRRMRALVQNGYLGGPPVHMESYYGYELVQTGYAGALLSDRQHWVRALPGGLLQNVVSHGIARIAEFLIGASPRVITHGFTSQWLQSIGEHDIIDELRVIINDEDRTTAYFTLSSQMRPSLHQFRIYGMKNGLVLDQIQETLVTIQGNRLKLYAEQFLPPLFTAQQYLRNVATNVATFLKSDFHMKAGMKYLIESFYRSITDGTPPPISYREILLTARIMDTMFIQLKGQQTQIERPRELACLPN